MFLLGVLCASFELSDLYVSRVSIRVFYHFFFFHIYIYFFFFFGSYIIFSFILSFLSVFLFFLFVTRVLASLPASSSFSREKKRRIPRAKSSQKCRYVACVHGSLVTVRLRTVDNQRLVTFQFRLDSFCANRGRRQLKYA